MPSLTLLQWTNDRLPRLRLFDAQCAASLAATPPNPTLVDENLRGYVVLLSAHFQGYCRDLYTEAASTIASKVRATLRVLVQDQFTAHCGLDRKNPTLETIVNDFNRFDLDLRTEFAADPANARHRQHLADLNQWRNVAAHWGKVPVTGGPLNLPTIRIWRRSCDGLATTLDGIVYNRLRALLRRKPW